MKNFVSGALVGAAAVAIAWWLAPGGGDADSTPYDSVPQTAKPPGVEVQRREQAQPAPRRRPAPADQSPADDVVAPFPPGEAVLHVGEGYVFGETAVRRRGETDGCDLVCLDLQDAAVLRCLHGGRIADVALGSVGMPRSPKAVADLVADAPADLVPGDVDLSWNCSPTAPGVGLVGAARGAVFKVFVIGVHVDKDVLRRWVRIAYVEVPARPGGGIVTLATSTPATGAPTLADLDRIIAAGRALPGDSFSNFLGGTYERMSAMPAELVLQDGKYLLVDEPLATLVEFHAYSGLVASKGVAASGRIRIRSYTGVAVRGDMAGEIDVGSYAYVHISGNLTGKLPIRSYATVVIDGDLIGEVDASSYVTLLLRGRLLGKLAIKSGNSHFWFQQYMGRDAAESLAVGGGSGNELHLKTSDLATGQHDDVPGWRKIVVGEDAWNMIAK